MNHTPHVLHELSEYLDGECRDPERIARHLQSCPDCARRHVELLKLSGHLRALRGPEAHPAFVTRVMAHALETTPKRFWFPRLTPRVAAVFLVAVLAAAGTWRLTPGVPSASAPPTGALRVDVAWRDDARVVEALGRLMDVGAPTDLFGDLDEAVDIDEPAVALDTVLESLADDSVEDEFVDPFGQEELSGLMGSLEEEDIQVLRSLLDTDGSEV
jgi:hypothetical protein